MKNKTIIVIAIIVLMGLRAPHVQAVSQYEAKVKYDTALRMRKEAQQRALERKKKVEQAYMKKLALKKVTTSKK